MNILKYTILSIVIIALFAVSGCKDDSEAAPSETDQQLTVLMNNGTKWVLSSNGVTKDGYDVTSQFSGFKLNIGNKTYSTENGVSPVWEASGAWDFQDNNPALILRDDGALITVSINSNNLILTFTAEGVSTGGRTESVSGEYQFHLVSE